MNCKSIDKYFDKYLSGKMIKEGNEKFEKHIDECNSCSQKLNTYKFINKYVSKEFEYKGNFYNKIKKNLKKNI